jgi:phasin family protein
MYNVPEQVVTTNKETLESVLEFASIATAGVEKLIDLQLKASKAAFGDATKTAKALASTKDVQELTEINTAAFQPTADKTVAYARSVFSVLAETQTELAKFFEERVGTVNKNFASAIEHAAKSAPAGSDVAVAAVKSALAAANQAYDAFSKASKQVSEVTEATFNAAATTTAKKKAA